MTTMRTVKLSLVLATVGMGGAAAWVAWPRPTAPVAHNTPARPTASIRTAAPPPRWRPSAPEVSRRDRRAVPEPGAAPASFEPPAAVEAAEPPSDAELTAHLTEQVERSSSDPELTADTRDRTRSFFEREDQQGSHVRDLRCGDSLCRLDVVSDDLAAKGRLVASVSELLPPHAEGFAHIEGPGDLELEIFLGASDVALPQ